MNEELLNGSFQLLILQLMPGAFFSLQILGITISVRERLLCEVESRIPFCHHLHLGISTLKLPFSCRSLRCLPAQGLNPQPRSNYRNHKTEPDPPLAGARHETPAMAIGRIGTESLASGACDGSQSLVVVLHRPYSHPNQHVSGSSLLFSPKERNVIRAARVTSPRFDPTAQVKHILKDAKPQHGKENHMTKTHPNS